MIVSYLINTAKAFGLTQSTLQSFWILTNLQELAWQLASTIYWVWKKDNGFMHLLSPAIHGAVLHEDGSILVADQHRNPIPLHIDMPALDIIMHAARYRLLLQVWTVCLLHKFRSPACRICLYWELPSSRKWRLQSCLSRKRSLTLTGSGQRWGWGHGSLVLGIWRRRASQTGHQNLITFVHVCWYKSLDSLCEGGLTC